MTSNNFLGRTVAVINDLTLDERRHLYSKAKELKEAMIRKDRALLNKFKINDEYFGMRRAFLEDSTRTKGSFTSAMEFLNVNEHDFDVDHSSINKSESYFDSINTLVGYDDDVFVIRSKLEGVCRYLEEKTYDLGYLHTLDKPAFVNAGDGKHEHPTQEILDGYTFLEDNHWDYSHLHIALIGDLFHGRTIHSKVDGLKIFHNVKVDLIAPNEIALQDYYVKRMEENGFEIRTFESIEEYLDQKDISKQWYFTRPQLERMGEKVLAKQDELRKGITASVEFLRHLEDDTHFYHPLPRHKEHPTLPTELDGYSVNGWTRQSKNGKLTRIVLLGAIAGVPYICDDFEGQSLEKKVYEDNFIEPLIVENSGVKNYKQGVRPLKNGVVIDHISRGSTPQEI
ncbi:aspartate carbamoyltransferase, partial [Candidatus Woesearchaeota archaeon]|nr:aspartate carbamoyltransferase [Candidatus Woesearchaeota archaeon]